MWHNDAKVTNLSFCLLYRFRMIHCVKGVSNSTSWVLADESYTFPVRWIALCPHLVMKVEQHQQHLILVWLNI